MATLIYTRIACPTGVLGCAPTAVVQSTREYCSHTQKLNLVSTGSLWSLKKVTDRHVQQHFNDRSETWVVRFCDIIANECQPGKMGNFRQKAVQTWKQVLIYSTYMLLPSLMTLSPKSSNDPGLSGSWCRHPVTKWLVLVIWPSSLKYLQQFTAEIM